MQNPKEWCRPISISMSPHFVTHLTKVTKELGVKRSVFVVEAVKEKLQEVGRPAPAEKEPT